MLQTLWTSFDFMEGFKLLQKHFFARNLKQGVLKNKVSNYVVKYFFY